MEEESNSIKKWANAHVFYNLFTQKPSDRKLRVVNDEYLWRKRLLEESPNSDLILNNSFFNSLRTSKKIYLAHITYNLREILKNQRIYSSGGCLIGSIYCTPLASENGRLRMHNLGVYLAEVEALKVADGNQNFKKQNLLIFEIKPDKDVHHNLIGVDYLRLGEVHYEIYKQLEYLLSRKEKFELCQTVVGKVKQALGFLSLCNNSYLFWVKIICFKKGFIFFNPKKGWLIHKLKIGQFFFCGQID